MSETKAEVNVEGAKDDKQSPPRESDTINISLQRSPVFYANLAKRFLFGGEAEVKLTGLGDATTTVVGAAEILKRQEGMVVIKKVESSLSERSLSRLLVVVVKGEKFDEMYKEPEKEEEAAAAEEAKA
eukprot:NODE_2398_length_704_cov_160.641221_g1950_i0.p1 GENE.NODE_2398_length_704_cov_160.641221_g1950_i0~~NODE_2398_length_704_cov_160.641221_g1950_i0.p1  ORF type:complete len:128 (-),score=36.06 NODE_2398_length_704_cov_160.641221_g1950_i0:266-649(-)